MKQLIRHKREEFVKEKSKLPINKGIILVIPNCSRGEKEVYILRVKKLNNGIEPFYFDYKANALPTKLIQHR